jgi:hypothetical protein
VHAQFGTYKRGGGKGRERERERKERKKTTTVPESAVGETGVYKKNNTGTVPYGTLKL